MIAKQLEDVLKKFFGSQDPTDWKSKDSWQKRALFWKLMTIAHHIEPDDKLTEFYHQSMKFDLTMSPPESAIVDLLNLVAHKWKKSGKSDIVIAKS